MPSVSLFSHASFIDSNLPIAFFPFIFSLILHNTYSLDHTSCAYFFHLRYKTVSFSSIGAYLLLSGSLSPLCGICIDTQLYVTVVDY